MADQGGASERVFSITLPVYPAGTVLRYYVQAMAGDNVGALAFDPPGAEHDVYTHIVTYPHGASSSIVINELMAKNQSTIADPQGQYDDWIELKNVSGQTVDLSGMCLSDNPRNPLKWQFPEGTLLGPGEYLLVWADEDGGDEPGLHANFKLSSSGETIWLWDAAQNGFALLDCATFEDWASDQPVGRYPDGVGPMQILTVPSPGRPNVGSGAAAMDFRVNQP
ncbi:MAG: lamin tail domain-containing protein [Phycisphaerae bacterium]|nr:lamin tail domain-containing protein [Phycisphaerae bacterium]